MSKDKDEEQLGLFNLSEGRRLKELGMEVAANHRHVKLVVARRQAREAALSRSDRTASADDVTVTDLGNASGSIFKGKEWRWTGRVMESKKVSRHAGMIKVWELVY